MIYEKETTSSTMDDAKDAIRKGTAKSGDVFTAKLQTRGRGRCGRVWETFPGNLYYTIILKDVSDPQRLGFFISLALADLLDARLKWPNDILLSGKKTAGILIESFHDFMIVGIGVNIVSFPKNLPYPATCLRTEGIDFSRETLLPELTTAVLKTLLLPFQDVLSLWQKRAVFLHETITVKLPDRAITGVFKGLDQDGFLLLETDGKLSRLMIGDVFGTSDK